MFSPLQKHITKVKKLLIKNIKQSLKDIDEVAIPFSGSLDSSLIAYIVKNHTDSNITLYTIGLGDCYDFKQSRISAKLLKHKPKLERLDEDEIKESLKEYQKLTGDPEKVSISFTLPFFILLKSIKEKYVITAHGADTLFGGFHKYLNIDQNSNLKNQNYNLKLKIRKEYEKFCTTLPKREYKITRHLSKKLILPFTDKKLAKYVLSLPKEFFIKDEIRKYGLRIVAKEIGLPEEITNLPKKAFQYSSGIIKPLKKIWKKTL